MSQAGPLDAESSNPQIPTSFITDDGTAVPINNELELLAAVVPNAGIPFESVGAGNVVTYQIQYADETAVTDATKVGVASFDSAAFDVDANGFVTLIGGGVAATNIGVDTSTAPGTDPVVPDGAGNIDITGGQVASGVVGANVIRTNSTAANSLAVEIQRTTSAAGTNVNLNGVSHFNSTDFSVDANGFVSLSGSGNAIDSIGVDATSGAGTNPVLPTAAGLVTVNGALVAAGTNPIRSVSTAANVYQIQAQTSQALAATDATKVGLSNFDSADFTVDANGFVALAGGGAGQTITGDTGGALSPTAGNWNILGQQAGTVAVMDTIGTAPSTLRIEDRTWTTAYVVDASATVGLRGTFTTIQAAITAASSGTTIFIRPGTYSENLTMKAGVSLQGYESSAFSRETKISGTITCTYGGQCTIAGLELSNTGADIISITGASQTWLTVKDCFILMDASAGSRYAFTCSNAAGQLRVFNCRGDLNTNGAYFNISEGVFIGFDDCDFRADALTSIPNVISGPPTVYLNNCQLQNSTTMTAGILQTYCTKIGREDLTQVLLTLAGARLRAYFTDFATVTATAITIDATSTAEFVQCSITDNAATGGNLITNAGALTYDIITQRDPNGGAGQGIIPAPTTSVLSYYGTCNFKQGQLVAVTTPGAYPYTTLQSDYLILVDSSSARTITPLASPKTGQKYYIKDNAGSAGTNNITITPSGKNIDGGASYVISENYGGVDIVYNGTQWDVVSNKNTGGAGDVTSSANLTDHAVVRGDGGAKGVQTSTMLITDAGEMTNPSQPAFMAYQASNSANATGNGTTYTLGTTTDLTEVFDQNADFDPTSGTFTAPVTGRYSFNGIADMNALTAAMTTGQMQISTSNRLWITNYVNIGAGRTVSALADHYGLQASIFTDMDAADTAICRVQVNGAAGDTAGVSGGANATTAFSGKLEC